MYQHRTGSVLDNLQLNYSLTRTSDFRYFTFSWKNIKQIVQIYQNTTTTQEIFLPSLEKVLFLKRASVPALSCPDGV